MAKKPFSASDVEWLRRLPTDPAGISHDDVVEVLRLQAQAHEAGDVRLIKAIVRPIAEYHDAMEQAHNETAREQLPPPAPHPMWRELLIEAIEAEQGVNRDVAVVLGDQAFARAAEQMSKQHDRYVNNREASRQPIPARLPSSY